jgi:predicted permease
MLQDLVFALREMRKSPGFALAAIFSLGLGIGLNGAIFAVISALFLRPLPVHDLERLAQVETIDTLTRATGLARGRSPVSLANLRDFSGQSGSFAALGGFAPMGATLGGQATPRQVAVNLVSANYFEVLGVPMQMGNGFAADADQRPGASPYAVLSDEMWKTGFGGDANIIGRKIILNSSPFVVLGVTPRGFKGTTNLGDPNLIWVPLSQHSNIMSGLGEQLFDQRRFRLFTVVGRLRPAVSLQQADAEMKTIAARLEQQYPLDNKGRTVEVSALNAAALGFPRERLQLVNAALLGASFLVLLIACVNVANLLLVRAASRGKEIGVRSALGAGRNRLIRQLLTESMLLASLGAITGLALAGWGKQLLWSFRPSFLNARDLDLSLDWRVLAFAIGLAVLTGLLFGLAPAWSASTPDLMELVRSGGGRAVTGARQRVRSLLVMGEVAICFVALAGAGLFWRSMQHVQQLDPGFESRRLLAFDFNLSTVHLDQAGAIQFAKEIMRVTKRTPGVVEAGLMSGRPLGGGALFGTLFKEGQRGDLTDRGILALFDSATPSIFETLRIPVRAGRGFTEFDRANTTPVAVINEAFAHQMWPGENAIGKRFFRLRDPVMREVVGVAGDTAVFQIGETPQPAVYLPLEQLYQSGLSLMARTSGDPGPVLASVLKDVQPLERNLALTNSTTVGDMIARGLWAPRMGGALFGLFGVLGLALACIGVYGVVSFNATERTREMGIRLALGSPRLHVIGLVMRHGLTATLAGIAAGVLGAVAFGRLTVSLLFETSGVDPLVLASMAALLIAAAGAAAGIPAWRAACMAPVEALREQ